jgi:VWFA-related protein
MRHNVLLVVIAILFSSLRLCAENNAAMAPAADEPKQGAASATASSKITVRSQLVLVPVVVTGKDGAHIGGLSRDSFTIEEHGKARVATIFEEVKTVAPDAKSRPAVTIEGRSNFSLGNVRNWRMTIVVLDMLNTPYLSQAEARRRLTAYLSKSLQREEPTVLFGLRGSGLRQLHPFTTDTSVLIAALNKVAGEVGRDEMNEQSSAAVADMTAGLQSSSDDTAQQVADFMNDQQNTMSAFQQRDSIRTTLTALTQIAHAYAAIPGRKTMIWASGGFPFMIDDPQAFARMGTDMVEKYEETWRALVSADIAVYTVDVTGLAGGGSNTASGDFDAARRSLGRRPGTQMNVSPAMNIPYDKGAQKQATLRAFAGATGGIPCVNTSDLEKCFARAIDDSRSYYLLGYYLPSDDQKPGWRKLKVKVKSEGAHVQARDGFYASAPAEETPEANSRQIANALRSPVEFTGVRLNVREVPVGAGTKPVATCKSAHEFLVGILGNSFTVDTQEENTVDVSVVTVAFAANGKNAGQTEHHVVAKLKPEMLEKLRKTALGVKQSLELAPGKYDIHFAVRDNLSGEIGSVEYPLEVK